MTQFAKKEEIQESDPGKAGHRCNSTIGLHADHFITVESFGASNTSNETMKLRTKGGNCLANCGDRGLAPAKPIIFCFFRFDHQEDKPAIGRNEVTIV